MRIGDMVYLRQQRYPSDPAREDFAPACLVELKLGEEPSLLVVFSRDGVSYVEATHGGNVGQWQGREENLEPSVENLETETLEGGTLGTSEGSSEREEPS